ncbi:MAG: endonuclease/exonuclease/phosphatase family protein [Eudoraea sp.]|nr:endonuclease/exonuclease/phosphatase family protein [Eudoraea sp.]
MIFLFCEPDNISVKEFTVRTIAFYNVENLFDTINDTLIYDDDRTPEGKDEWTLERYNKKVADISGVLAEIGLESTGSSPDIIGLCEVEKQDVVEDLVHHPNLIGEHYGIIHTDSPDERGIDVALIYKKSAFLPIHFVSHRLLLLDEMQERDYTRDQLVVSGRLDNNLIHLIINHWPSRSGGASRSRPGRIAAARLNKRITDSILKISPDSGIIIMGDFNDNPTDDSLKKVLRTKSSTDSLQATSLFNPMESLFKKGLGTLAYRDEWSLFDQILLSGNLVSRTTLNFSYWKVGIYNPSYLITQTGRFKGYPYRTYAGGIYTGGFSDHFPVYVVMVKEVK